ncbi:MAG: hypothetical protein Q7I99_02660 [Acholeplasmataceae bacterium]|nr:hypothetical protein [Acholeplasmataceae bacterium]
MGLFGFNFRNESEVSLSGIIFIIFVISFIGTIMSSQIVEWFGQYGEIPHKLLFTPLLFVAIITGCLSLIAFILEHKN